MKGFPRQWSRRRLLQTVPVALGSFLMPKEILLATASPEKAAQFSKFVNVASGAGLTHTMI